MVLTSGTTNRLARACAVAATALFICTIAALAALHVLRPDDAAASNFVGNHAVDPYGWVMSTFFSSLGWDSSRTDCAGSARHRLAKHRDEAAVAGLQKPALESSQVRLLVEFTAEERPSRLATWQGSLATGCSRP